MLFSLIYVSSISRVRQKIDANGRGWREPYCSIGGFFIFSFCLSVFSINFWFFLVLVEGNLVTFCLFLRKMVDCQGRWLSWTMLKQGQTLIQNLDLYHLIFLLLLLHLRANQDHFASNKKVFPFPFYGCFWNLLCGWFDC